MEAEKFLVTHKRPCFGNLAAIFLKTSKKAIVFVVVMVTLLYHPFLLLYHYYAEIVILSTNQISA